MSPLPPLSERTPTLFRTPPSAAPRPVPAAPSDAVEREAPESSSGRKLSSLAPLGSENPIAQCLAARRGPPPDADALIARFHAEVFPKVKGALEAAGASVNSAYCEMAAGMTKYALDRLGIPGARIVASQGRIVASQGHAFVEVPVRGGGFVVLDPTAAQFTADHAPFDRELQARGLAGTKAALRDRIAEELEAYNGQRHDPLVLAAFRSGDAIPGETPAATAAMVEPLAEGVEGVMAGYEAREDLPLALTAEKERAWACGDRDLPLMLIVLDEKTARRVWSDESPRFRIAYDTLDRALGAR